MIRKFFKRLKFLPIFVWYKLTGPPRILRSSLKRNAQILRIFGARVGYDGVRLHAPITIHEGERGYQNLTIEDGCILGGNNFLDLSAQIILEKGVSVGPGVIIMTHNRYNYNAFLEDRLSHTCGKKDVIIKEGAGIKAGAIITMGVTIGINAVVAAGAVVNHDVPDHSLAAGIPAKVIKEII